MITVWSDLLVGSCLCMYVRMYVCMYVCMCDMDLSDVFPAGHHAERDKGMGFCIFNNIAIAALHARTLNGMYVLCMYVYRMSHVHYSM